MVFRDAWRRRRTKLAQPHQSDSSAIAHISTSSSTMNRASPSSLLSPPSTRGNNNNNSDNNHGTPKSKFSFDKLFFGASGGKRSKLLAKKLEQPETNVLSPPSSSSSRHRDGFFSKKSSSDSVGANASSSGNSTPRSIGRSIAAAAAAAASKHRSPPPILTPPPAPAASTSRVAKVQHMTINTSTQSTPTNNTSVRLCLSPGGRNNMQLAIPITPPSATSKARKAAKLKLKRETNRQRASLLYGRVSTTNSSKRRAASSATTPPSNSNSTDTNSLVVPSRAQAAQFWNALPRDTVTVDVLTLCAPLNIRVARATIRHMLHANIFAIRSTKWAAYFLQLVTRARSQRRITAPAAVSLRFAICARVQWEVTQRQVTAARVESTLHKKMTDYKVALQCISGSTVVKFGRKGKPHATQLVIENGESFRWIKLTSSAANSNRKKKKSKKKAIALASVVAVRTGPLTDVLVRALQKGTLALQDAKCTMSLVTPTRTFDLKAKTAAEREWLHRSFSFLVALAREHEKRVAQQVELSIMKRMETLSVWKHGRKGRPHKTHVLINRFGEIAWHGRSGDSIQIDEIAAIELGHATAVFKRSLASHPGGGSGFAASLTAAAATARSANCCFSLVARTRTLDIETESETIRDWFVVAFRYLMDKVHEKTAAIRRDKAEKQLKMLQELCGSLTPSLTTMSAVGGGASPGSGESSSTSARV